MSVTLTTPYTVAIGGTQVENDTVGACTSTTTDFIAMTMTYTFMIGTLGGSPSNLIPGAQAQLQGKTITVTVYIGPTTATQTFGQWWLNGVLQGSIVSSTILNPSLLSC